MDALISSDIVCKQLPRSRAIHRFVEKHVRKWLASQVPGTPIQAPRFHVSFEKEGAGHEIYCRAEVQVGDARWAGARHGEGPQQAFLRCLEHMCMQLAPLKRNLQLSR